VCVKFRTYLTTFKAGTLSPSRFAHRIYFGVDRKQAGLEKERGEDMGKESKKYV
jgi:hypothetical protein